MQTSKRVLVVDDTRMNRNLISSLLRGEDCQVSEADSGESALELSEVNRYDIIFMDINLPGLDGIQTTKHIRENDTSASQRATIIGISAHASEFDRMRCSSAGMNGCLPKPIELDQLVAIVKRSRCTSEAQQDQTGDLVQAMSGDCENPVLDTEAALSRIGGNESLYRRFVQVFHEDVNALMADVDSALKNDRMDMLQKAAHRIRGMSSNLAANRVTAVATEIENSCSKNSRGKVKKMVEQLKVYIGELEGEFVQLGLID